MHNEGFEIEFYRVVVGGRNCLPEKHGSILTEGDIICWSYGKMLLCSDGKRPTVVTCMSNVEPKWEKEAFQYERIECPKEIVPYLHKNKFWDHIDVKGWYEWFYGRQKVK